MVDFQVHEYIKEIIEMPPRGCGSWLKVYDVTKLRPASGCVSWEDIAAASMYPSYTWLHMPWTRAHQADIDVRPAERCTVSPAIDQRLY